MSPKSLVVLLPCPSLESLSLDRDDAEAEEILSAWTALYHPELIAATGFAPRWSRAEEPPEDLEGALIVLPSVSESLLPADWIGRAEEGGATLVRGLRNREQLLEAALAKLPADRGRSDPDVAADFLAAGFCHFQIEILTRQLRYSSNLDEIRFQESLVEGAKAAVAGDRDRAKEHLRSAFDRLTESREYFYPSETYLLDLTLVASTTLGPGLQRELLSGRPLNLLLPAEALRLLASHDPKMLEMLRSGIEGGNVSITGGEATELELPLLHPEEVLANLKEGLEVYKSILGQRPTIFGRRRFGLTPFLPQVLRKLGFEGMLHFTLDGGRLPASSQSKIRWEGLDGTEIEAIGRLPLDAAQTEGFFRLSERLGNTTDDYNKSCMFAHWPGQVSPWYDDLRRVPEYSSALGKLTALPTYFQNTQFSGRTIRHSADKYRSPYLRQEVDEGRADPISRWVRHHRLQAVQEAAQRLNTLAALLRGKPVETSPTGDDLKGAAERCASTFSRTGGEQVPGCWVFNPAGYSRRAWIELPTFSAVPAQVSPVALACDGDGSKHALVDAPPLGFVWLGGSSESSDAAKKAEPPVAEDNTLRNEFFQAAVSPTTGALRSITNYAVRGNRLAAQIAMRTGRIREIEAGSEEEYSIMAADELTLENPLSMMGRITTRGRIVDRNGERLAGYRQTFEAWRGDRVLRWSLELDIDRLPKGDPWDCYYAVRFAWVDETADLDRGVGLSNRPTDAPHIESPFYFDLKAKRTRLAILTGGLPYHRRFGRKLDTLLVVPGETARSFQLGLAVDAPHPVPLALDFLAPPPVLFENAPPPAAKVGWLFHLNAKNVIVTALLPLVREERVVGYRARLLETEGRGASVGVRAYRNVAAARRVNFLGEDPNELPVEDDKVTVEIGPHQWVEIEAEFA